MYDLISGLVIYRNAAEDEILWQIADITLRCKEGEDRQTLLPDATQAVHKLLDLSTVYGFDKNLWHSYLAYILAMTETPFTLVSEKRGKVDGTVNELVKHDLRIFRALFDYDFGPLDAYLGTTLFATISSYRAVRKEERVYNKEVSEKVGELARDFAGAADVEAAYEALAAFYGRYGVGMFGLNKAFRVSDDPTKPLLTPITGTGTETLCDLVGYETQKKELRANTEAFLAGRPANNVLLYGDAGTGKSTSVKAVLNEYYDRGLRMIELYKHQCKELSRVIDKIKDRNYRFIIFMDDLSFEEFETDYKYLKAVIEGGLEPRPDNVLIYATSNRRHLIRETWRDKNDTDSDDIHRNDTVQEKLSLANRFGVMIGYFRPRPEEYHAIVRELARKHPEITLSEEELRKEAAAWEVGHGGFSGRTARQFVDHICGRDGATR